MSRPNWKTRGQNKKRKKNKRTSDHTRVTLTGAKKSEMRAEKYC
jgi:hypothetical protein